MLQKLTLRNFQCHEKFVVRFDPAVTVLVGESDRGKSAVLRALALVCLNRPSGGHLVRATADKLLVKLEVDGHTVRRGRGAKGAGFYTLDAARFAAVGKDVPAAVRAMLNVSSANFQFQFDPSFWVAASAGQVSKALNEIVNLQSIDAAVAHANKEVKKAQTIADHTANELVRARADVRALRPAAAYCEDVKLLQSLQDALIKKTHQIAQVRRSAAGLVEAQLTADRLSGATLGGKKLAALGTLALEAAKKAQKIKDILTSLKKWQDIPPTPDLRPLEDLRDKIGEVQGRFSRLRGLVSDLREKEKTWRTLRSETARAEKDLRDRTKGVCPACGRPTPS